MKKPNTQPAPAPPPATGERWTSYESRLPGFKVLVVPEAEAWEYEAPAWLIDRIIADHNAQPHTPEVVWRQRLAAIEADRDAKAALLDDTTARIADLERERDGLRQDWLEHTQLLDDAVKALASVLPIAWFGVVHASGDGMKNTQQRVEDAAATLARIRPPEGPNTQP